MNDDMSGHSLICAAVDAMSRGSRVAVKVDGDPEWIRIASIKCAAHCPGLVEVQRAASGGTVFAPIGRLVSIEIDGAAA